MALVVQRTDLAAWIDESLDYLTEEWEDIPHVADGWNSWDELDRLVFVEEWPLRTGRLHELQRWRDDGLLSAEQLERFKRIEVLIELHSATLERLFET